LQRRKKIVGDLIKKNQALVEVYSQALREGQKQAGYENSMIDGASTSSSFRGNYAYKSDFVHLATGTATGNCDTHALASIPTTRSLD
jgi:hypothetical protein